MLETLLLETNKDQHSVRLIINIIAQEIFLKYLMETNISEFLNFRIYGWTLSLQAQWYSVKYFSTLLPLSHIHILKYYQCLLLLDYIITSLWYISDYKDVSIQIGWLCLTFLIHLLKENYSKWMYSVVWHVME